MDKIGKKLQTFATLLFLIEIVSCIVMAIVCWAKDLVGLGFIMFFVGPILSYFFFLLIAGFGKLIDNSDKILSNTGSIVNQNRKQMPKSSLKETFKNIGDGLAKLKPKWTCSCGQKNNSEAKACINCGKEKKAVSNTPTSAWICSCGTENDGGIFCKVCGKFKSSQPKPKAVVESVKKVELSKWTCSCGQENRGEAKACINCGKAKE